MLDLVPVYLTTKETRTKDVDPSVLLIPIVHRTKHAFSPSVETPVQALVVKTQIARQSIICHLATVARDIPETPSRFVRSHHHHLVSFYCPCSQLIDFPCYSYRCLAYNCILVYSANDVEKRNPCSPSPCGPNSQCREINDQAVCSCLPTYIGSPPGCRPECVSSSECPSQLACINQKCENPCPSPCGLQTNCVVVNHSPICSCLPGYSGDPFTRCTPIPRKQLSSLATLHTQRAYVFLSMLYLQLLNPTHLFSQTHAFHPHVVALLSVAISAVHQLALV